MRGAQGARAPGSQGSKAPNEWPSSRGSSTAIRTFPSSEGSEDLGSHRIGNTLEATSRVVDSRMEAGLRKRE